MVNELIKQLLEAGVHFGHQSSRWNPKMAPYIFGEKNGVYVIDLEKTVECLKKACDFLSSVAAEGKSILFVGTKKQAQDIIMEQAKRCGMFYVNTRWLGGTLTNFGTIKKSIARLKKLKDMQTNGSLEGLKKKEITSITKEIHKLENNLQGIIDMEGLPGALFIIDSKREEIAVKEANKLCIPIAAVVDTNSDPDLVTYPIAGNDDAIRSIKIVTSLVADAVEEGRQKFFKESKAREKRRAEEEERAKKDVNEDEIEELAEDAAKMKVKFKEEDLKAKKHSKAKEG